MLGPDYYILLYGLCSTKSRGLQVYLPCAGVALNDTVLCMQGFNYPCASEVPVRHRRQAFSSVMDALAKLHGGMWVNHGTKEKTEYLDSDDFFQHQVGVV